MNFPPHKSQGRTVMTSDYVDVLHGVLRYSDEAWESVIEEGNVKIEIARVGEERARRGGVLLDISKDGYFTVLWRGVFLTLRRLEDKIYYGVYDSVLDDTVHGGGHGNHDFLICSDSQ